jgi:uncharacterized protein (TIGR02147 family)
LLSEKNVAIIAFWDYIIKKGFPMKSIFNYNNYRKFLLDYYNEEKARNYHFSHRYIAEKLDLKSSGHFAQIFSHKANISISLVRRMAEFLRLKKKEAEYFEEMVLCNQAKNHSDKKRHFERMQELCAGKKDESIRVLDSAQYEFYNKLYYSAIRELLAIYPFKDDYKALGKLLDPPISAAQVKNAIALLEKLGLIRKNSDGVYERTDAVISSGYDAESVSISNFLLNAHDFAKQSLERAPRKERNCSWMTMSVSQKGFEEIQQELRLFMRKALEIARKDLAPDRVYLGTFDILPLSKHKQGVGS